MTDPGLGDSIASRYRLLEELGGGGMGTVFRARDEAEGRDVAIKILRRTSPEAARRLQREARATEGLDADRVARVLDVGETPSGRLFLVMEHVEGRTLRALLREGRVARGEALRIVREIATTLAVAHRGGLVHRDVKPDNVIVRRDGGVVLLDFGLVKHFDPSDDAAHVTTQLTSEGTMLGTPAYLAPEQALGRDVGPAVDQFALAVTAFELLTGKLPWSGTDVARVLAQLLADTRPPASTVSPDLPKPFDAVLARGLAKSPGARFDTVEAFADALEAADRGVLMASPASSTRDAPSPGNVATSTLDGPASSASTARPTLDGPLELGDALSATPRAIPHRSRRALAALAVIVASGGAVFLARGRSAVVGPAALHAAPASAPRVLTVSTQAPLACPIFAVEGMTESGSRLGAAASALACARAKWYLGGSDDRVLVPAALLDAPVEPREDLWDFYESPDGRARTQAVAKGRALPSLDGTIVRGADSWRVDLAVRAADGSEIARVSRVEARHLDSAIRTAVVQLWQTAPLAPASIDPDVARWTGFPDIEAGLIQLDLTQGDSLAEGCASVRRRGASLGRAYYPLRAQCTLDEPEIDAGALVLDETSAPALVTSANAILDTGADTLSEEDKRRVARELEAMRGREASRFGRASIGRLGGILWGRVHDVERAHSALLTAVADDPLPQNSWFHLLYFARGTGSSESAASLAAVWEPQEPAFLRYATTTKSDELDNRLRDGELAYLVEPMLARTLFLGRALAEAGRAEEVRALAAATPADRTAPDPDGSTFLLACIDLHDALFARALARFEAAGSIGLRVLPALAEVLGRTGATATRWATAFLDQHDATAEKVARGGPTVLALCMNAGGTFAGPCLARLEKLGAPHGNAWGVGGDVFLRGAQRFAAGDVRGAVDAWRPIVASPNDELARLLPTAAFERAGEHDLAARIDARKLIYRQLAGVSEAAPREARRALARKERARAKELAESVVQAWGRADAVVPAVAEMRALLSTLGD